LFHKYHIRVIQNLVRNDQTWSYETTATSIISHIFVSDSIICPFY